MVFKVPDDKTAHPKFRKGEGKRTRPGRQSSKADKTLLHKLGGKGRLKTTGRASLCRAAREAQEGLRSNTGAPLRSRGGGCQRGSSERWHGR